MKLDSVYKIVDEGVAKNKIKGIDFVAYHGSHEPNMKPMKGRALFLTDSFELAEQFAKGEIYGDGLYDGETATVFTFKGHFNNPYYMTHEEYDEEGQDSNIDYKKWVKMGVDGIVLLPEDEWETTYYIVIDLSTIKLTDKKVFDDEELDESVIPEQVPEKLYHATFSKLLRKIKRCGYLGKSPYKLWSDSNNKYVYLATDPDEAYSYAETALDDCDNERLYDMLEDDDIVILEIDTRYLDKNKLFKDENVVDGETTYQYEGIINCQIMKIYKPTLDESIVYGEMNDDEMMVILHNPTRKELKDNNLDDECRIIRDGNGGYYFASSVWTHEQIENKLKSKNLPYEETMGEFYYYQDNLFATRDDWNTDEEYNEYKQDWYKTLKSSSYIVKNFGNFNVEIFGNEKLRESVFWKGERINNYEQYHYPLPEDNKGYDPEDEMIVWKNPSAEWMKYQIDSGKYFRFTYITTEDTLFVWYGDDAFHTDTMDIAGVDGDVVGTMSKGNIDYWPDDDDSPALGDRLFREKRAKFLDTIYPNGYETGVQY